MLRPYEKLIVWQEAYALCLYTYAITSKFPKHELFGLVSQMRRSSYSVPTNIAEGNTRRTAADKYRFLIIAHSSLEELHCESRLSLDLKYISEEEYKKIDDHIQRTSFLLIKLMKAVEPTK